jgi:hypothetical protein
MATITLVFTSNSDGSITASTSAYPEVTSTHKSLKALVDVAKGWVQQYLNSVAPNTIMSD